MGGQRADKRLWRCTVSAPEPSSVPVSSATFSPEQVHASSGVPARQSKPPFPFGLVQYSSERNGTLPQEVCQSRSPAAGLTARTSRAILTDMLPNAHREGANQARILTRRRVPTRHISRLASVCRGDPWV